MNAINNAQSTTTDTSKDGTLYLVVQELGVKIPLNSDLKNAYYKFDNGVVYLYLDIPNDTSKDCSNQATLSTVDATQPEPLTSSRVNGKLYTITGSQSGCSTDKIIQDNATKIREVWLDLTTEIVKI